MLSTVLSHESDPAPSHPSDLEIKSILLLDDDTDLAETLKALLESHNFIVTTVHNGAEGFRETLTTDFDVIICDMLMPTMPGDMFYLAVKKTKPQLAARFLFITAYVNHPKVNDFLGSIEALVMFKPVLSEDLLRMISLVIKRTAIRDTNV
jgi:CheY-like chemotaxis protein